MVNASSLSEIGGMLFYKEEKINYFLEIATVEEKNVENGKPR